MPGLQNIAKIGLLQLAKTTSRDDHVTLGILQDWFILDHMISRDWIYVVMARKVIIGTAPEG